MIDAMLVADLAAAHREKNLRQAPTGTCRVRHRPPRVDQYAQVSVRGNKYSVPAWLIGRQVRVLLNASDLVIHDGRTFGSSPTRPKSRTP